MILLTIRDLTHRATRFTVVTLLCAVVFSLLFVMTGLVEQFNQEPFDAVDAFGAETWVMPDGVPGPFTASSSMPVELAAGVDAEIVASTVVARSTLITGALSEEVVLVGHEVDTLGSPPTVEGRAATASGEVVVDSTLDVDLGASVVIGGTAFTVVGRSDDTTVLAGIPLAFTTLGDAQDLAFRSRDVVGAVLVRGTHSDLPDGLHAVASDAVAAESLGPVENAISSVDLVRGLLWMVAALIIGAVVYLSALERQRDFAVLKAVGVSNASLLGSLAIEAILVAVASVALGALLQLLLAPAFPLQVRVPARAFWQVPLLAIVVSLLAGMAGMRRVARSDPALAFAAAGG